MTTVKLFEYTAWKDKSDTPGDIQSMLDFMKSIQNWQPTFTEVKPILIHCG